MITLQERVHGASKPSDWVLDKLHQVLRVRKGYKNEGMKEDNLLSLSYGRIVQKDINSSDGLLPENFDGYQIVEPGNIVLRLTDLQNDKRSLRQGLVTQKGIITSAYDAVEVQRDNDPTFWFYSLFALDLAKHYYSLGGGVRQSIKFSDFPNDWVYRPDLPTQRAIADFLDRETARIDLLIEKKQRLVALLDEKRSATVTAAIAGEIAGKIVGEGVECGHCLIFKGGSKVTYWSENIRHSLRPLKHICHINPSVLPETTDPDWEFDYIDIGSVKLSEGVKHKERVRFEASPSRARKPVKEGDILVSTVRTYLKAIAAVEAAETPQVASTGFAVLRAGKDIDARFLYRVVQSNPFVEQVVSQSTGVSYPAINPSTLGDIAIPVPNLSTQREVASFLDRETARIQNIQKMTQQSIDRLKEYRSALITAAVTGQINVAEWSKVGTNERQLDAMQAEMEH